MNLLRLLTLTTLLTLTLGLTAQVGNPAQAGDTPLQTQFEEMLDASNRFQTFKVIRQDYLSAFINNVGDSISGYTRQISDLQETIANQAGKIDEQAAAVAEREGRIAALSDEKDSISLLGVPLSKTTYSIIMWSTILALLAALLFAIARMRLAVSTSREGRLLNEKVSAELESSRKSRLKVEQDLRRQLQDERNKRS